MQRDNQLDRRTGVARACALAAILAATFMLLALPGSAVAQLKPADSMAIWEELKPVVFGDRPIVLGDGVVTVVAPKRAQEAGLVPIDIVLDPSKAKTAIKSFTMIIDVNPSPVAATFTIGEGAGVTRLSTRVRINDYSFVRVIAETAGGDLHMAETFVKASGGCSAPAAKNPDEAKRTLGVMKLRQFPPQAEAAAGSARELQLLVRHPNHSGLQMDQVTRYFIPAHFVRELNISQGGALVLKMEGGISISEDPNFRFDFKPRGGGEIAADATDTEGQVFHDSWPLEAAGL